LPLAFQSDGAPLPTRPEFHHAFSGLVMLADWIGSDERFFPYAEEGDSPRLPWAMVRGRRACEQIGIGAGGFRAGLDAAPPSFNALFGFPPRGPQIAIAQLAVPGRGGVVTLEAETGAGKTEAALDRFVRLFHSGRVDGMYFALPTRTAATQLHGRVVRAIERAFPDPERRPPVVLAVPGYLVVDETEGRHLPGFQVLWNDSETDRWRYRGWAAEHPKRYLAGTVVVGTIDQVLLSGLQVSHAHLRSTALSRHLLVIDEVHASDTYMNRILEHVLERHLAAGGHALLMSATLGAVARARLTQPGVAPGAPSLEQARDAPFPLVTSCPAGGSPSQMAATPSSLAKRVTVELCTLEEPAAELAKKALDAARAGARVLIVRNTVTSCVSTQQHLEAAARDLALDGVLFQCKGVAAPHHSRYAREDRALLDAALELRFGSSTTEGHGCVTVATQTLQQSLDIDGDLLITDLCPMDVLLQRIGRLHRHGTRIRPRRVQNPRVILVLPHERNLGLLIDRSGEARAPQAAPNSGPGIGSVYEDLLILEATWRCLEQYSTIEIPAMNRDLVERTTHPERLSAIAEELGGSWEAHLGATQGIAAAHRRHAELNLVRWDEPIGDQEATFPTRQHPRRIPTRLGEADRLLHFDAPAPSPFGCPIQQLTIPAFMARGIPNDPPPTAPTRAANGELEFTSGSNHYRYDRFGLRLRDSGAE